jgi:pilus assembly protein CpaB
MRVAQVAVLGIAIVAGGIAALLAYRAPEPTAAPPPPPVAIDTVKILVAVRDISIGQVVSAQDMDWRDWPRASTTSQDVLETVQPNAKSLFEGEMARIPIQSGWPVWASNLIDAKLKISSAGYIAAKLTPGKRAVSVEIAADTAAGGSILPNDHVDVIHTYKDRLREKITGVETYVSDTVLTDIPVLAIDQTFEEKPGVQTQLGRTATLELDPLDAEELMRARMDGKISLSLRSLRNGGPDVATRNGPVVPDARALENVVNVCRPLLCEPYRFRNDSGIFEAPRTASN